METWLLQWQTNLSALANPDPEILPEEVQAVRDDAVIATGRSDYPNQINNVSVSLSSGEHWT